FVTGEGWIAARSLRAGDRLVGSQGESVSVGSVVVRRERAETWNLEVAEDHTYFVAAGANAPAGWVHNDCTIPPAPRSEVTPFEATVGEAIHGGGEQILGYGDKSVARALNAPKGTRVADFLSVKGGKYNIREVKASTGEGGVAVNH